MDALKGEGPMASAQAGLYPCEAAAPADRGSKQPPRRIKTRVAEPSQRMRGGKPIDTMGMNFVPYLPQEAPRLILCDPAAVFRRKPSTPLQITNPNTGEAALCAVGPCAPTLLELLEAVAIETKG